MATDDKALLLFFRQEALALMATDPTFSKKFGEWFQSYFVPYRSLWSFSSLDEYYKAFFTGRASYNVATMRPAATM